MDLHFNSAAPFTRWLVARGALNTSFVVIDVGVQGGENPRWHLLGDYLIVHGFDAIEEVVQKLTLENRSRPNRHYHWIAAGDEDAERTFYFNAADPCSSSFSQSGPDRFDSQNRRIEQARSVRVRRLDTLFSSGIIPKADFLKIDVEGFEKDVLQGSIELLRSVLGVETESNFNISPTYPKSHFGTLQELLLARHFLVFDINFNRIPRASYQHALTQKGLATISDQYTVGRPATLNVLFCRDLVNEADCPQSYIGPLDLPDVDQILKLMTIYELHGLSDIALDTAERFKTQLGARVDVDKAIHLLADPRCRSGHSITSRLKAAHRIFALR
jgi:FkbM family methyltransferase